MYVLTSCIICAVCRFQIRSQTIDNAVCIRLVTLIVMQMNQISDCGQQPQLCCRAPAKYKHASIVSPQIRQQLGKIHRLFLPLTGHLDASTRKGQIELSKLAEHSIGLQELQFRSRSVRCALRGTTECSRFKTSGEGLWSIQSFVFPKPGSFFLSVRPREISQRGIRRARGVQGLCVSLCRDTPVHLVYVVTTPPGLILNKFELGQVISCGIMSPYSPVSEFVLAAQVLNAIVGQKTIIF